mgnify:FL=1|jgi:hypothetical protein
MDILWREVVLALFTLLFMYTNTIPGYIIAINGVLCHGSLALSLPYKHELTIFDSACNICLTVYVNLYPRSQPLTGFVSCFSFLCWRYNNKFITGNLHSIVHATCVQLPLFIGLRHYSIVNFSDEDNLL